MVALRSHATTLVLLALCSCFAFLHVHSELMDPQIICESCLLAAREIEKTLRAVVPRKRRPVLMELMVDNEVCNRLAPSEGFLKDDLAAACVQLFDSYSEDFYLTLMSRPPKLLESIFCYQKSSACESVEEEDEDEEGEPKNMEDVPIAQHSQTATKDEL